MTGNILLTSDGTYLILYQLDLVYLSIGISETPVLVNNIINMVYGEQDSYYLSGELSLGPLIGSTIDICPKETILNLLNDQGIVRVIVNLGAQWAQGIGNPSPEAIEALKSLVQFMKGNQGE